MGNKPNAKGAMVMTKTIAHCWSLGEKGWLTYCPLCANKMMKQWKPSDAQMTNLNGDTMQCHACFKEIH
jgi:hypothetical protein